MDTYKPPCNDMKIVSSVLQQPHGYTDTYLYVEFLYMEETYQEIENRREFTIASFFSDTGGYVGMILGYSLLQTLTEIGKFWDRLRARQCFRSDVAVVA